MVEFPFSPETRKIKLKFYRHRKNPRNVFKENFARKWVENPRTVYGWLYKRLPRKFLPVTFVSLPDQQLLISHPAA
jgi:hypothetical protein